MQNEYKLEIYVTKDNVTIKNKEKIHTGEYKITKCEFEFTEDYEGLTKKAIFEAEDVIKEMPIISNECDIPEEVLRDGYLQCNLRVYGYDIEEVDGEMTVRLRYSPTYDTFPIWKGSFIPNAEQGEEITPTQFEQYTAALNEGLEAIEDKIEEADEVLENIDTAIEQTNNLDLDVSKEGKVATVTLTKKDATTKVVTLSDGTSLMFNWDGTKLGIKTDEDAEYTYVDLQGVQGPIGPQGEAFQIKKTYSSIAEMNADFDNMQLGDYVMIASSVQIEDNAKLYTRGQEAWIFISDFSGAQGIKGETGATPNIQIGSVTSGNAPSVTRTGTNENPILNFVLEKGETGATGATGATGETGNGIASIVKTGTSGLIDTYTITFTDGTTTTFEITNGEDGEVTQAQLDETNRMVEQAKLVYNALPKVNGSGEEITLNNTAETPLGITLKGNTYQETTTGKNLLTPFGTKSNLSVDVTSNGYEIKVNGSSNGAGSIYSDNQITLPAGTYSLCKKYVSGSVDATFLYILRVVGGSTNIGEVSVGATTYENDVKSTFTLAEETTLNQYLYIGGSGRNYSAYKMNVQIVSGSEADYNYEIYTNGPSPNPTFPQNIEVVTGNQNILIQNKNLWSSEWEQGVIDTDGVNQGATTVIRTKGYISVKPNTNYSIKRDITTNYINVRGYDKNKIFVGTGGSVISLISGSTASNPMQAGVATCTIQPKDGIYYLRFNDNSNDLSTKYMMVEGNTPANYVEAQWQNYPISLGNLELCKIGDYQDYIYGTPNNWYIRKAIQNNKYVGATAENWSRLYSSSSGRYSFEITLETMETYSSVDVYYEGYSSRFTYSSEYSRPEYGKFAIIHTGNYKKLRLNNGEMTVQEFKTWLSTNNVELIFPLATPTSELITEPTLIEQLNNLYYAYAYQEQTNINQENSNLASIMNAETTRDLSDIFTNEG